MTGGLDKPDDAGASSVSSAREFNIFWYGTIGIVAILVAAGIIAGF